MYTKTLRGPKGNRVTLPPPSHGLNNWTLIKPLLYINIEHILQTDKPTDNWIFLHSNTNFAELSNLMLCINKLYLYIQWSVLPVLNINTSVSRKRVVVVMVLGWGLFKQPPWEAIRRECHVSYINYLNNWWTNKIDSTARRKCTSGAR